MALDGSENQYKYQITKKWKLKKNISNSTKTEMCRIIEKRAALRKQTILKYKGKDVNKSKLRRLIKTQARRSLGMTLKADPATRASATFRGPVITFGKRMWLILFFSEFYIDAISSDSA
jgi:hypothetical protein